MISTKLLARRLLGLTMLAALTSSTPARAEEVQVFSLGGVHSGMPVAEVRSKLGAPSFDSGDLFTYADRHLRVFLDPKTHQRVIDVTGEVDLAFGGRILARLDQSTDEIHALLGTPDETTDGTSVGTWIDTYTRFHVTVYYRRKAEDAPFMAVMFSVTSPESDYVRDTDPSQKR